MLTDLIKRYLDAKGVWEAQFDEDEVLAGNSPEWQSYMGLSVELIEFRCSSMAEVSQRAAFFLRDVNMVDTVANGGIASTRRFLKSMVLPSAPVDIGEND